MTYVTCQALKYVLFADDTNLFASGDNLEKLCNDINRELLEVNNWFEINKLSLNLTKTNFMVFTNKRIDNRKINIVIEEVEVERVYECKFLGVIIDSKLTWKAI